MPRHYTRAAYPARSGMRRRHVWATAAYNVTLASGAKNNTDLLANLETAGSSIIGCTVVRTLVRVGVADSNAATSFGWNIGLIVATAPPLTGTIDAATEFGLDWMLLSDLGPVLARNAINIGSGTFYGDSFDIRSKRKISQLSEKFYACSTNSGSTSGTITWFVRTLLALP